MSQDFLDQLERQLVEATERGARRRHFWHWRLHLRVRLPTFAVAAVAVTAVTATALAAELGLPAVAKHPAARTSRASGGSTGSAAGGFDPQSFTAISEFTWWLLGTRTCGASTCLAIARTEDGGRSFVWLPVPAAAHARDVQADAGVDELRFASADDGYAFGSQLWTTHDGGLHWGRVRLGGWIAELAAAWPYVYAIVERPGHPGRLMRSLADGDHWVTLRRAGNAYTGLWVQGSNVVLDSQAGSRGAPGVGNRLMVSDDDGDHFASHTAPPISCQFEEAAPNVIWAPCVTGSLSGLSRSTDAGASFAVAAGAAAARRRPFPNMTAFAAAGPEVAVMGFRQLYRTLDGGQSFERVPTPKGIQSWTYLGFTDATHGVALGLFGSHGVGRLYYTINAGASYHYVPIDPQ